MAYPNNTPRLDEIVQMPVSEVVALPADTLAHLVQDADAALRSAKSAKDWLVNAGVKTHHSPEQKYTTCYEAIPGVSGCPGSP